MVAVGLLRRCRESLGSSVVLEPVYKRSRVNESKPRIDFALSLVPLIRTSRSSLKRG